MEITLNLEPKDWYRNSTANNMEYWGLDYPPLTGWHSLVLGHLSNWTDPASVALETSLGYSSPHHKLFMRLTVVFSELLTYIPAVLWFFSSYYRYVRPDLRLTGAFVVLCLPVVVLIDHGHFQYNSVMLGFSVAAFTAVIKGNLVLASVMFTLALNFKQMALYYSLPLFFAIISKAYSTSKDSFMRLPASQRTRSKLIVVVWIETLYKVVNAGVVFIVLSLILWYPYLTSLSDFLQVVRRIFPVERGVFEDKVATFWCVASVILKFKAWLSQGTLVLTSALLTLVASAPSLYLMLTRRGFTKHFLYCLSSVSLAFFLLSYHVHEKSIMLPLVPVCLVTLLDCPQVFLVMSVVSSFSLYPLMVKDHLQLCYFACTLAFAYVGKSYLDEVRYFSSRRPSQLYLMLWALPFIHLIELLPQSAAFPYLFELIVAAYSFLCFAVIWGYLLRRQFRLYDADDSQVFLEQKLILKPKMP
jgi:alpha-1,3-glucosyltransferase